MHINGQRDPTRSAWHAVVSFDERDLQQYIGPRVLEYIAQQIASQWVHEHYQEVAAHLDPQAIANLTAAHASAKTRELLDKKLPDQVREITRTEIYSKGLFGGLKRVR